MELIHTTHNVKYLPLPNQVEFITSNKIAPISLTKTSFVIPFIDQDRVVIAHNQRRGLEIPGGHVDPGETLYQTAIRECLEETGHEISEIIPVGYLKMTSEGEIPEGWKYPHPISYQQFFTGIIDVSHQYEINDECSEPSVVQINNLDGLTEQQIMLIVTAHKIIYGG